jgi:hypothetical protein
LVCGYARLADAGPRAAPSQHRPADLGGKLGQLKQASKHLMATGAALQNAMAPPLPTRTEQIERAQTARTEIMAKALRQFEAGEITGHDVAALEIGSADYLENFIAGLPR